MIAGILSAGSDPRPTSNLPPEHPMSTSQLVLPLHDDVLDVHSPIHRSVGQYRTRVFLGPERTVLLISELPYNSGASVTNALGEVVAAACTLYRLDDRSITVVEHYDHRAAAENRKPGGEETFGHVVPPAIRCRAQAYAAPRWMHVDKATVEGWIGGALP